MYHIDCILRRAWSLSTSLYIPSLEEKARSIIIIVSRTKVASKVFWKIWESTYLKAKWAVGETLCSFLLQLCAFKMNWTIRSCQNYYVAICYEACCKCCSLSVVMIHYAVELINSIVCDVDSSFGKRNEDDWHLGWETNFLIISFARFVFVKPFNDRQPSCAALIVRA